MSDRILIVEDDREIRSLLCELLLENEYEVVTASDGSTASKLMREQSFSLILMDLMLPFKSGDALIKELREYSNTPVIVLSAKSMMETRLEVLRVGADDYIIKPFDLDEVLVRIQVVLRRSNAMYGKGENLAIDKLYSPDGGLVLDMSNNCVYFEDAGNEEGIEGDEDLRSTSHIISLTAKEMALLMLFLKYPAKTFTKADLYEAVWNDTYYYEDNTINVHMSNLRSKLKKQTGRDYIDTVWGVGYRLREGDG